MPEFCKAGGISASASTVPSGEGCRTTRRCVAWSAASASASTSLSCPRARLMNTSSKVAFPMLRSVIPSSARCASIRSKYGVSTEESEVPSRNRKTPWVSDTNSALASGLPSTSALTASGSAFSAMRLRRKPPPNLFLRWRAEPMHESLPPDMMATRSPRMSASSIECVVSMMTRPFLARSMASHTERRVTGSIPVVGSSKKTTLGSPSRAMARERRRCIPPE
mmetsp:Transcript_17658/g.40537  ORF Transcript_17658/g.40537 Transcript_17658/m.40537 type:complete len:223 (-) Transcript_17658:450-1118(-)